MNRQNRQFQHIISCLSNLFYLTGSPWLLFSIFHANSRFPARTNIGNIETKICRSEVIKIWIICTSCWFTGHELVLNRMSFEILTVEANGNSWWCHPFSKSNKSLPVCYNANTCNTVSYTQSLLVILYLMMIYVGMNEYFGSAWPKYKPKGPDLNQSKTLK